MSRVKMLWIVGITICKASPFGRPLHYKQTGSTAATVPAVEPTPNVRETAVEPPSNSRELRVGSVPDEWYEILKDRADNLRISVAALHRMILGDWIRKESRR
jgi:hypothetical protein